MKLLRLLSCTSLVLFLSAAEPITVGPKRTEIENGDEVWKARLTDDGDVLSHKVNDLGKRGARPKLVYNCALAPALCNNARRKLNGGSTATMHYDYDRTKKRSYNRRKENCRSDWRDDHACPESNQPKDFWFTKKERNKQSALQKKEVHLWRGKDGNDAPDPIQFAEPRVTLDADGTPSTQWYKIGAAFSCDEWPAASWIEGGNGANIYCAPQRSQCTDRIAKLNTEQDFQAEAHNQIINWYGKFIQQWPENTAGAEDANPPYDRNFQIFKFDFELVSDGGSKYATWVEALGRKRYCYPKATDSSDCKTEWDEDPDNLLDREP